MNFEKEVLHFYDWMETNSMGTSCICLWFALMHTWHKAGYPQEFTVAISVLEMKTGLKRNTIQRTRNTLKQIGLIDWRERKGNQSAAYKILPLKNTPQSELQLKYAPQGVLQSALQSASQTDAININNNIIDNYLNNDVVVNNECQNEPQSELQLKNEPQNASQTLEAVLEYYEQRIKNLLSPTAYAEITEFLEAGVEDALICRAIDISNDTGARNWNYAKSVINNCIAKGILTLEQYKANEANREAAKVRMNRNGGIKPNGSNSGDTQQRNKQYDDAYKNIKSIKL